MSHPESPAPVARNLADVLEEEMLHLYPEEAADPTDPAQTEAQRLKQIFARLHESPRGRTALCFSGGGIRSASFGLGVLQRLAKCGALADFDFLSTVSGGGYLGAWLSAWIRREGRETVFAKLGQQPTDSPLQPEWAPIKFLRAYSNYLAPRLGFLSADTWALIATFLRNMLLNWMVLIPPLLAALMIPRFFLAALFSQPPAQAESWAWICAMLLQAFSIGYAAHDMPSAGNARLSETRFVLFRLVPLIVGAYAAVLAWAWRYNLAGTPLAPPAWGETFIFLLVPAFVGGFIGWAIGRWRRPKAGPAARPTITSGLLRALANLVGGVAGVWLVRTLTDAWFREPTHGLVGYHLAAFGAPLLLALFLLVNFLVAGLAGRVTDDEDREWWGRSSGWMLLSILALAVQGVVVFWGPYGVQLFQKWVQSPQAASGALAALTAISGAWSALHGFSHTEPAKGASTRTSWKLTAGAITFILLFDLLLAYSTQAFAGDYSSFVLFSKGQFYLDPVHGWTPWLCLVIPALAGVVMSALINVNRFSLHTMYRDRLIRTFLGASHTARKPHPFTGFDPDDNLKMSDLPATRPLHIVNVALNLVSPSDLAWQERKAQSFTLSRLHAGAKGLGYQPVTTYGGEVTLGTAVTISGAAANPNMGYHSSPLVSLLMTLFNVRLGWWLPNPGPRGAACWSNAAPRFAAGPLFSEAFGRTDSRYPWVNLSDGGHFENLGLYEMVLRRCRSVVVVDGGQDGSYVFEDLGNAVRKVRIDFGIQIDIDVKQLVGDPATPGTLHYCALGTIRYSTIDGPRAPDGRLVYLKPVITSTEPMDVRNYRSANPAFPHESTGDQFFSESQLESYRMLGWHAAGAVCGGDAATFASLDEFLAQVARYTGAVAAAEADSELQRA